MQYKGDDLDLRVPQGRQQRDVRDSYATPEYEPATATGRWARTGYASNGDPLWVDEVLLHCCNYAFDIAAANGAGEVGLEHLVNALTRVEGAARVLEARGVREAQLRRESATLIASEIPVNAGSERVTPRRGADFEDIVRRAVEQAGRRGTAATVDDVLWVILHHNREMPAVLLLRRLTPDWQRLDWGRAREVVVQQPAAEPLRVAPSVNFDTFSSRISQIEDSLRGLHADLAAERKVLADLIRDAQRDIVAQRGDAASLRSDLAQRLEALERGLQARTDTSRLTVQLSDRIQTLEKAVHGGLGEGARNWAALGQRLQTIETSLDTRPAPTVDIGPLMDRLGVIEQAVNGRIEASARVWNAFAERLAGVEKLVEAGAGQGSVDKVFDRLGDLETLVQSRPVQATVDTTEFQERLGGLERAIRIGFGDAVEMTAAMTQRLEAIESRSAAPMPDNSEALLILDDRMQSVERMLQDRLALQPAMPSLDPVLGVLHDTTGRINALEQQILANVQANERAAQARDLDVKEMHEAIVRLSENQMTLASAIADWRHESHNDFNAVNAQIEKMTIAPVVTAAPRDTVAQPAIVRQPMPASVAQDGYLEVIDPNAPKKSRDDEIYQPPVETAGGHGFWWWLFGTSSVTKANRDAEIRWQRMHDKLREARDRRRERA